VRPQAEPAIGGDGGVYQVGGWARGQLMCGVGAASEASPRRCEEQSRFFVFFFAHVGVFEERALSGAVENGTKSIYNFFLRVQGSSHLNFKAI